MATQCRAQSRRCTGDVVVATTGRTRPRGGRSRTDPYPISNRSGEPDPTTKHHAHACAVLALARPSQTPNVTWRAGRHRQAGRDEAPEREREKGLRTRTLPSRAVRHHASRQTRLNKRTHPASVFKCGADHTPCSSATASAHGCLTTTTTTTVPVPASARSLLWRFSFLPLRLATNQAAVSRHGSQKETDL